MTDEPSYEGVKAFFNALREDPRSPVGKGPSFYAIQKQPPKPKKIGKPKKVALYEEYDPQKHGVRGITIKAIDGKAMVQVGTTTIYTSKGLSDEELERREERKRRKRGG